MIKFLKILIVMSLFVNNLCDAQNKVLKTFSQQNLYKNKIYTNTYELWQHNNRWFPSNDTIAYMVDNRNYKGIINYNITFHSQDYRVFNFTEDFSMFHLPIKFESCVYNPKDSIVEIEGTIKEGWGEFVKIGYTQKNNYAAVFIGEIKDTISLLYFKNSFDTIDVVVKHNNKKIEQYTVMDTFPAFYFKKYISRKIDFGKIRHFKIKHKINEHSILAFGAARCYSEIYDIGSMVFNPKKNKPNKIQKQEFTQKKIVIKNILQDTAIEKINSKEKTYYDYTEEAEKNIVIRQYAKAKQSYNTLDEAYSILYARDIHNAVRCALLTRDYERAFYWAEKLAQKGIKINYFDTKIFNQLKKNKQWNKFSTKYDSIYNENKKKQYDSLRIQLEQLVEEDQTNYGLTNRKNPKILYETTERVTDKLITLLQKYGYPSEEKIGVYMKSDTVFVSSPVHYVLIRHAIQQNPKNITVLQKILDSSSNKLEFDYKRSGINVFLHNACFHVYKGNLYRSKSCAANELMVRKIQFIFNNPYGFILQNSNFVITEYDKENPEMYDTYYKEQFNFIVKLTDDWEFYNQ